MTSSPNIIKLPLVGGDECDVFGRRDAGRPSAAMRRNAKRTYTRRTRRTARQALNGRGE